MPDQLRREGGKRLKFYFPVQWNYYGKRMYLYACVLEMRYKFIVLEYKNSKRTISTLPGIENIEDCTP
jgi:hypothetical protein